jgi:hypothetical protein
MLSAISFVTLMGLSATTPSMVETQSFQMQNHNHDAGDSLVLVKKKKKEELNFIDKYFPFMPSVVLDQEPLEKEIQENFWLLYVLYGILAPIGSPVYVHQLVLSDVKVHKDHQSEAIVGWLLHEIGYLGYITFYWPGLIWTFANGLYFTPIFAIHCLDRNIKKKKGKKPAKWSQNKSVTDLDALPGMPKVVALGHKETFAY